MDAFLGSVTKQAMNYAVRSGIALTSGYVIKQSSRLLANAPKSDVRDEVDLLQQRLQHKIRIISPCIDMIELISARGNTSLESAVALTKELRHEIHALGVRLAEAAKTQEITNKQLRVSSKVVAENETELHFIKRDIKQLLERIEDAVPLINLAIQASGATLSSQLPHTVSPSRLLQASTFLTAGDTQYQMSPRTAVQIGPTFNLTVYMLFAGHTRPENEEEIRETTWKEVIHKARVKLRRVPLDVVIKTGSGSEALPAEQIKSPSSEPVKDSDVDNNAEARADEFAYQLMIIEDFDDDRMHDFEDDQAQPGPFDDVKLAGIREMIPIHEVSKIFYADTSKVLNIGTDAESNHPVLLLKRDINAVPPRRMIEREGPLNTSAQQTEAHKKGQAAEQQYVEAEHADHTQDPWRLPPSLDPEWIAFEVYTEANSDSESEADVSTPNNVSSTHLSPSPSLDESISKLNLNSPSPTNNNLPSSTSTSTLPTTTPPSWTTAIRTSLSLLELLLRLTSLQQFQQSSHLSITDELLNFFLEESSTTGAGGDEHYRQHVRADARRRVGWDPYDESPVKRRGEEYQYQNGDNGQAWDSWDDGNSEYSPQQQQQQRQRVETPRQQTPNSVDAQTRSISRVGSGSPSPGVVKGRPEWLRRQGDGFGRRGSPLRQSPGRPGTGRSDEGLGTSPASEPEGSGMSHGKVTL